MTVLKNLNRTICSRKPVVNHFLPCLLQDIEKPRGRKRGVASSEDQDSKPKRGRKKAVANTTTAAETEEQWDEDNRPEDEQNSPPKKGRRGRPPKSAAASQVTPAKGKRGRKKAAPPPEDEEEEEEEEEEEDKDKDKEEDKGEVEAEDEEEEEDKSSENVEVKTKAGRQTRTPRKSQGWETGKIMIQIDFCQLDSVLTQLLSPPWTARSQQSRRHRRGEDVRPNPLSRRPRNQRKKLNDKIHPQDVGPPPCLFFILLSRSITQVFRTPVQKVALLHPKVYLKKNCRRRISPFSVRFQLSGVCSYALAKSSSLCSDD